MFILAPEIVRSIPTIILNKTILSIQYNDNFEVDFIILSVES